MLRLTAATALTCASAFALENTELIPNVHLHAAGGASTADEASLASHGHDPSDEFTLQGLEFNLGAKHGEHLSGFFSYNTFLDSSNSLDGEWEEGFLKLTNLPGGFELRGGRLLNRVSTQNNIHLHGWDFVDANLITTRFFGEEGLITNSGEISWNLPVEHTAQFSLAFGEAISHGDHGHGHGDEEDHDDVEDHEEEEHHIEGEGANYDSDVLTARIKGILNFSDYHQLTYGATYIHGNNEFGRTSRAYGADLSYLWRQNGLEPDSRYVRATAELAHREFDFVSEDGDESGSADEWGIHTALLYGFLPNWELGLRYDFLEGIDAVEETPERHRYTAALTRRFDVADQTHAHVRLQYNHDHHSEFGGEDSVWLQLGFDWGQGGEIR